LEDRAGDRRTNARFLKQSLGNRDALVVYFLRIADYAFTSGASSHADRIATIRRVWKQYNVMIDTHTADGLKVGLENREPGVPLIVLETALPAKFEETIIEALGEKPWRPKAYENIEALPQRSTVVDVDVEQVKAFVVANS